MAEEHAHAPQPGPVEKHEDLRYGPLGESCLHLCVDMQRMFYEKTEWHMPWMERVLPNIERLVSAHPSRTSSPGSSRREKRDGEPACGAPTIRGGQP